VRLDREDVYWIERRSQEGGRKVIVRRTASGQISDVRSTTYNARTRVHEYGGRRLRSLRRDDRLFHFADQCLYVQRAGSEPNPLTPVAQFRYAEGEIDVQRNFFLCA
jgi:hypothetical protein